jgi:UDP-N-acetylmuramoyl-L-alanyl-D-glutamate--2,6-diaminopimelate ligase
MRTGLEKTAGGRFIEILDRRAAIRWAIGAATGGDSVVIAGKGHETYQIYKDWTVEFDDRHEARLAVQELGWQGEKR